MSISSKQMAASAEDVLKYMQSTDLYFELLQIIDKEGGKSNCDHGKLYDNLLEVLLSKENVVNQIHNLILEYKQKWSALSASGEEITAVKQAHTNWQRRIVRSINSMCSELNLFLSKRRSDKSRRHLLEHWTEMSTEESIITEGRTELQGIKPIYGARDLLEVVSAIEMSTSANGTAPGTAGGSCNEFLSRMVLIRLNLPIMSLEDLRERFRPPIGHTYVEFGIDDAALLPSAPSLLSAMSGVKATISSGNATRAAMLLRTCGCPPSLRRSAWLLLLGVHSIDSFKSQYYEQLKISVADYDLLLDYVLYKDVKQTVSNSPQYFVFEDYIYQVIFPFIRDTKVAEQLKRAGHVLPHSYTSGRLGQAEFEVVYPPAGVLPFHAFSMLVAPLCYVTDDPVELYYLFRELYMRYFSNLTAVASHPRSILSLAHQFEHMLTERDPQLSVHLANIGLHPLRIAFKWLMRGFADVLSSDQTLILWDRLIAFDSLDILPLFAVAIFYYRRSNLLRVAAPADAEAALADLSSLSVAPLLRLVLAK